MQGQGSSTPFNPPPEYGEPVLPPNVPPACEICGRQDETLRLVAFPYVISVIVMTFRRNFAGLWCWRHRMLYLGLSSLITAALGWIGIPFGFIYTPKALYTLSRGGDMPRDANVDLLKRLTKLKLDAGEVQSARRIVEEALRLRDDSQTRQVVQELYRRTSLSLTERTQREALFFAAAPIAAIGLGIAVGIIDALITSIINLILPGELPFLLAILTWGPLIALVFSAGLVLKEFLHIVLVKTQTVQQLLGMVLAGLMALMTAYGILQGAMIAEYLQAMIGGMEFTNFGDFIMTSLAVTTQGGFWVIGETFEGGNLADYIYLFTLIGATALYLWLALREAGATIDWLQILADIRSAVGLESQPSFLPNWLAMGAVLLVILFSTTLSFAGDPLLRTDPEAQVAYDRGNELLASGDLEGAAAALSQAIELEPGEAAPRASMGWALFYMEDNAGAIKAFEEAIALDPKYADPYLGLGYIYLSLGDYASAQTPFETALELDMDAVTNGEALYGLGSIQMARGQLSEAVLSFENALSQDWELILAHMDLALAYRYMGDFDKSVDAGNNLIALSPDWGAPHANLAAVYFEQDRLEEMERELNWAEDLASEDLYSIILLADNYWMKQDFSRGSAYLTEIREQYPDDEGVLLRLAAMELAQGRTQSAHNILDDAEDLFGRTALGLIGRAAVHIEEQNLERALELLLDARGLEPEEEMVYSTLSFAQFHLSHIPEAIEAAQEAIRLYPYNPRSFTNLAFALRAQGENDLALEHARHAIELSPKDDLAHFILGVLLLDRGEVGSGVEELHKFLDLTYERAYVRDYIDQAIAYLSTVQ
jgi:tetratricopeptide (TPR) repeat protein